MKLGALHIYVLLFLGYFPLALAIIKNNVYLGLVGLIVISVYSSAGIEYFWRKENEKEI